MRISVLIFWRFSASKCLYFVLRYVKSVFIRSYSGQYFPAFRLNTERHTVSISVSYLLIRTLTCACVSAAKKCSFFGKFCIRTKWMIPKKKEMILEKLNDWKTISLLHFKIYSVYCRQFSSAVCLIFFIFWLCVLNCLKNMRCIQNSAKHLRWRFLQEYVWLKALKYFY